jgi:hypothetical protein
MLATTPCATLRPWVGVPASFGWSVLADYFQLHRPLMVTLLITAGLVRCLLPLVSGFPAFLAVILAFTVANSPVLVMVGAAVASYC